MEKAKSAEPGSSRIDALFLPQARDMHGIEFLDGGERGCGGGWNIDPAYGSGFYWYLSIDDMAAIAVFDLTFFDEVSFGSHVPNFFCFGNYSRNMIPYFEHYFGVGDGWESGTLLGYAWKSGMCRETIPPNERLSVASVSLFPDGAARMAHAVGADPFTLTAAIASLDGTHRIPALSRLFDEIKTARLSSKVAPAYYRSKVVEACALLVDWQDRRSAGAAPRMRAVDRTSLNLACSYAKNNLGRQISLDDLCRVACASPSKLATIFKNAEGTTPMGWVRNKRMERACELLSDTDETLAEIAAAVGFERQGSFSEAFKQRFGVTPLHYRALFREK